MNKSLNYSLLLSILLVIAPHADHLPLWASTLCVAFLLWRAYLIYSDNPIPQRWLLLLITFASSAGILIEYRTLFGREAGVTLLMLLAALKFLELRTPRDAMVLIYLACFIIITNFFYSQSIPTAVYMMLTLMVIVTSWVQLQAQELALKPRLRIASILLLQALPLTLILFVLFPRVEGPLWGLPQDAYGRSGLDDTMAPGSLSRLSLSEAVAFRVSYAGKVPARNQMYWRGPVLWEFDGRSWTAGKTLFSIAPKFSNLAEPINYSVTLEPHNRTWLFALDVPNKISVPATLGDDFRLLGKQAITARMRYTASSHLVYQANLQEAPQQLNRGLALPQQSNPRARQLAADWRASSSQDAEIVQKSLRYFSQQNFKYTLEPPLLGDDTVDDFLFESKQGFCEHYASSFVFLMRAANVPARVVTGYLGGEFNDFGNYYIVRQSDAHAWAEVWLAGQGWVRVDPTGAIAPARLQSNLSAALSDNAALPFLARNPPQWMLKLRLNWDTLSNQWNQWVLGYDSERQFAFLTRLGMESITWQKIAMHMLAAIGVVIALFSLIMLRHLFAVKPDPVQAAWLKFCRKLVKAGLPPRAAHEAAHDYAMRLGKIRPDLAATLYAIATHYSQLRYGAPQSEQQMDAFLQRCAALKVRQGIIFTT